MLPPPSPRSVVKGTAILGLLQAIARSFGEAGLTATLDAATVEVREAYRFGQIVSIGWYPMAWYRDIHAAAQRGLGADPSLPWRLSHEAVTRDFRGVFQVLIRLLSPETVIRQASRLMLLYFKGGTIEVVETRPGYGHLRLSGWTDFDRNLWSDLQGGIVAVLEARGAKNVNSRVLGGGGEDGIELEVRWS
jgi:hypothetical protein